MKRFAVAIAVVSLLLGLRAFADESFQIHGVGVGSNPAIAVDRKGQLHLALEERKDVNLTDIFYAKSTDRGQSWTSATDISNPGRSSIADIVVDTKDVIDVAWGYTTSTGEHAGIYLSRSLDGGNSWTKPVNISKTSGICYEPDVAVGPDNSIHVAYTDISEGEKHGQIYYCFSTDSGATWSKAINLSNSSGAAGEAAITVGADGTVYVAWSETPAGGDHPDIYLSRNTSGLWTKPIDMSNSSYATSHPDIACGVKGKVHLCWAERSGEGNNQDICYRTGNSRGEFRRVLNLSDTAGVSSHPALVADDLGRVVVVWSNTIDGGAKSKIFGRASLDGGKQFSAPVSFSNPEATSIHPDVEIASNKVFVVWEDVSPTQSVVKSTSMEIELVPSKAP
jgi:hypothetical protein